MDWWQLKEEYLKPLNRTGFAGGSDS
jgi:hypothetical protein